MTHTHIIVAIAASVTTAGIALLLLRTKVHDSLLLLRWCHRWCAAPMHTASLVLLPLLVVAASCFASVLEYGPQELKLAIQNDGDGSDASDLAALRAYANSDDQVTTSQKSADDALPDVDTMIRKLISRLEEDPNDVNGWKMLGWSYLNTNRPGDAAKAYETALKLQPDSVEVQNALERAKSSLNAPDPSNPGLHDAIKPVTPLDRLPRK